MKKLKGYVFSRKFSGNIVPQKIQNIILRDYCFKKNYNFVFSSVEYSMESCFFVLDGLLKNLKKYNGLVAYSIFQLPEDKNKRIDVLESPEIVSSEKILIHYSGKFKPWNVKGILDKRSSYYQHIYRELFQEKYHLSYNYKKNALIDLLNGFRNKRILDLDFPFTFTYLVIKSLFK